MKGTNLKVRLRVKLQQRLEKKGEDMKEIEKRFVQVEDGHKKLNHRFEKLNKKIKARIEDLNNKVNEDRENRESDNVIAKLSLELDEAKLERGRSLEDSQESVVQVLNETVISGKVGSLTLDPQYLKVDPVEITTNLIDDEPSESQTLLLSATKLWIVIGCIIALVAVAIVQAGCTIYRTMKHPSPNNKRVYAIPVGATYPAPAPAHPHHHHPASSWTRTQRPW
ncbi:hypothetical protein J6590_051092 [Homalodisca vitripennis]|nr:hypothetical protein J6590_051092 [Homalodisca vitripennis]